MARSSALILALTMLAAPARALDCSSYDGDEASCNGCVSSGECVWKSGKCMTDANSENCRTDGPGITSVGDDSCPGLADPNGNCVPSWCLSWFDGCNTCSASGKVLACTEMFCDDVEAPRCLEGEVACPDGLYDSQGNCVPSSCAQWFDGCNNCKNDGKALFCTRKACVVYEESKCMDEEEPKGGGLVDEYGNEVPAGCESWFDGCNTCTVNAEKGILGCTKVFCASPGRAYCADEEPEGGIVDEYGNAVDPGCDTWFDGCNTCTVNEDEGEMACTRKFCAEPGKAYCADEDACADSTSWHKLEAPEKDCSWVSETKKRCLVKAEGGIYAFEECKATCGTCGAACVDDEGWHKAGEPDKGCAWAKRAIQRCAAIGESGEAGYEACKFACNTCEP
mmetsp:Transcript_10446/g.31189  ORF Transcript_10446/g.31189 Transcript_10446/m.31189 type:complete len:394 (-) Transcript_10446:56-1237(-)|eukprot:CAMPEP_0119286532 /NCGR_PEP_ID=MMETSP1329-20130426/34007_1 /TAXON_ID=114041 /ORGANISM="Genus nov. species nov., Strain RCC1024" /LENGTH=393 /DNA_ID=CAMNT_0007287269 /DNA_START=197 /DNA_END=1375 /DNA_ORIENTATION=-